MIDYAFVESARKLPWSSRNYAQTAAIGQQRTRSRGQGLSYAESRQYAPGDDVRHIDWKVTARTGETYTKLYEEEKSLHIAVAIDASASMAFGGRERTKWDTAASLAGGIVHAGQTERAHVELWVFDQEILMSSQTRHNQPFAQLLDQMDTWDPVGRKNTGSTDFQCLVDHLFSQPRRPQILCILSDFDSASLQSVAVQNLARNTVIVPVQIASQLEITPPRWRPKMQDAEAGGIVTKLGVSELTTLFNRSIVQVTDADPLMTAYQRISSWR